MYSSAGRWGDFPTIRETVLRRDPLVKGIAGQAISPDRLQLDIHLITRRRLIHDSEATGYSLWPFPPH